MKIKLGRHQATAIRAGLAEIATIRAMLETREALNKREIASIVADAGGDPGAYANAGLADVDAAGDSYLELTPHVKAGE